MLLGLFAFTACGSKGGESTDATTGDTGTEQPADHSTGGGHGGSAPADTSAQMAPAGDQSAPAEGAGKGGAH